MPTSASEVTYMTSWCSKKGRENMLSAGDRQLDIETKVTKLLTILDESSCAISIILFAHEL